MSTQTGVDRALENKHRTLWGLGDYGAIAADVVAPLGPELVTAAGVGPGVRVLDIAAGTGNAAIAAAQTGADVVASDLVPELLAQGQRRASAAGVGLVWQEANAEALPFDDGTFDTVLSCIGVMFAPHHQRAADELVRVCRPDGTVGLIAWTPEGFIGQMFATMKPFVPAPPPGASPPPLWGSEDHVAALFAGKLDDLAMARRSLAVGEFSSGATFRDYF
ncbi:MAG TPA: methyltransferase domain-containing protein, partial [Mycobacterium sp.]|nr:methyltransferase domain-containing protein [Mycobacterium sp.]